MSLSDELLYKSRNGLETLDASVIAEADGFCEDYKTFLDNSKTEREAVRTAVGMAEQRGYRPFETGRKYSAGDKVYYNNRGKALILCTVGTAPLEEGIHIAAAHIDSPRLDLKPNPLYESEELAYFKTHYYGGVKKYQWTATPLALHGVVAKKDGTVVDVKIGEDDSDPVLYITDLLPHLAADQAKRTMTTVIKGEELNILLGSRPYTDEDAKDTVKLNIMRLLNEKYGIVEADFQSAELCAVPAYKARDIGLDRSMIGSYGHDDRVCAYCELMAEFSTENPKHTSVTILADKEETGSESSTGMNTNYLPYFIMELSASLGANYRVVMSNSRCLSADVNAALDPTFSDVHEPRNAARVNHGVCITKYTGSGGKYGTNDASAEMMAYVRRVLDDADVLWQTGELGKVDQGGGGTVAKFIAKLNIDTVDVGVPMLAMHSPWELVAKLDVYMTYRAFAAFCAD